MVRKQVWGRFEYDCRQPCSSVLSNAGSVVPSDLFEPQVGIEPGKGGESTAHLSEDTDAHGQRSAPELENQRGKAGHDLMISDVCATVFTRPNALHMGSSHCPCVLVSRRRQC